MLHAILAEQAAVSPEMVLRLGRWCGTARICSLPCNGALTSSRRSGGSTTSWPPFRDGRQLSQRSAAGRNVAAPCRSGANRGVRRPAVRRKPKAAFDLYITAAFLLVEMGCPEEVLRGVVSRAFTLAA